MTRRPNDSSPQPTIDDVRAWWATSVSRIEPDVIEYRGHPIGDLIGSMSFVAGMWLLVTGRSPSPAEEKLLDAALLSSADHGPQAPSIASARMAITCGVGLNSAIANGVNTLGDVHGGAGQQCVALMDDMRTRVAHGEGSPLEIARRIVADHRAEKRFIPGFGHRFHTYDPRRDGLMGLVGSAVEEGVVPGEALACGLALEEALAENRTRPVPMNIDGATAVIYAELGCPAELARALFVLSRSVGIAAHAWEEEQQGRRIKGPFPPSLTAPYVQEGPAD